MLLIVIVFASTIVHAQVDTMHVMLDAVSITATRSPLPAREAARQVELLPRSLLATMPESPIEDILRLSASVDIRRRGPSGVQADLGMRGSTFGQNLVLVDGMRASDPQTGHHALVTGLRAGDIERIEILPGHTSALHGADAFGGLVNIVTRGAVENSLRFRAGIGQYGKTEAGIDWEMIQGQLSSRTGVDYMRHDGYRSGTDFRMHALTQHFILHTGETELRLSGNYADRDFGAFDFYSPGRGIPSRERIHGGALTLQARNSFGGIVLRSGVSWRRLHDRFVFDSRTPDRFVNTHVTDLATAEAVLFLDPVEYMHVNTGVQISADRISSSALGDHGRLGGAVFVGSRYRLNTALAAVADIRFDALDHTAAQWNPSVGIVASLSNAATMHISAGRSYRVPSYTDLYYSDPVNSGASDLRPEKAWSFETGVRIAPEAAVQAGATVFLRMQEDLIDYVLNPLDDRYYARNIHQARVYGADMHCAMAFSGAAYTRFHYQYLFSRLDDVGSLRTRYALTHPRHKATALFHMTAFDNAGASLALIYVHPFAQGSPYATVDLRAHWQTGASVRLHASAENLLNTYFEEIPGIAMPGRWMSLSAELRLF